MIISLCVLRDLYRTLQIVNLVVYIGAIAVLFLIVVMMLNVAR